MSVQDGAVRTSDDPYGLACQPVSCQTIDQMLVVKCIVDHVQVSFSFWEFTHLFLDLPDLILRHRLKHVLIIDHLDKIRYAHLCGKIIICFKLL